MAKNVNKKSDKKKNNPPAKKSQGHKIVAEKGSVVVVANNLDDSNFVVGEKNLVNSKEQKISKKSKSVKFSSKGEIPEVGDLPLGSHLPFSPNALFTGREKELKKLADSILGESKTNTVITQAVTGMGGLGKTQLAVEFGYHYGKYFRGVHWINLADPTQLDSEIANCGRQMFSQDFPEDQPSQVALTLQTWKTNGPNLLILDNFEEPSQANDVLTKLRHSNIRILVTSRRTDWSQTLGLSQLPLDLFSPEESLQFLKDSLKDRKDSEDDLKNLAERLGHLPLGLELASRYLNGHARLSIADYLTQTENALDHASMKNWRADMPAATGHGLDLQRTFALSWQEVKDETAKKMFMMAGYLAPNTPIPLEIFEQALEIEQEKCDEALNILYGLGLFRKSEDMLPVIHPLISEYSQSLIIEKEKILEILLDSLGAVSLNSFVTNMLLNLNSLGNHINTISKHAEYVNIKKPVIFLLVLGYYLEIMGNYSGAKKALQDALSSEIYDPEIIIFLGDFLMKIDEIPVAQEMYEKALVLYELDLENEHSKPYEKEVISTKREYNKDCHPAIVMHERLTMINVASLKQDSINLANLVNKIGITLIRLKKLYEAREMFEQAIKITENRFGDNHPNIAQYYSNLGKVLFNLGNIKLAKVFFERALQITEVNFGSSYSEVSIHLSNLGKVMRKLEDLNGAYSMFKRALDIDEAKFGTDHFKIISDVTNVGSIMEDLGDLNSAIRMNEWALKIEEKIFGINHPKIVPRLNILISILHRLDLEDKAHVYQKRSSEIAEKFSSSDHPKYKNLGEYSELIRLLEKASGIMGRNSYNRRLPDLQDFF